MIIDPHQDVWSCFTGVDGAPWWTLDAAGLNTDDSSLHDTGAAVLHQFWDATEYGEMPRMCGHSSIGNSLQQPCLSCSLRVMTLPITLPIAYKKHHVPPCSTQLYVLVIYLINQESTAT